MYEIVYYPQLQVSKYVKIHPGLVSPRSMTCARHRPAPPGTARHLLQVLFLGWDDSHGSHTSVRKTNADW